MSKSDKVELMREANLLMRIAELLDGAPKESALRVLAMTCIIFGQYDEAMPIVQVLSDSQLRSDEPTPSGIEDP